MAYIKYGEIEIIVDLWISREYIYLLINETYFNILMCAKCVIVLES